MFTGLVESTGAVIRFAPAGGSGRLDISAPSIATGIAQGDSIAVNGCCLTAERINNEILSFHLLGETLRLTNLGRLAPEDRVNLERALAAGGRVGGHFVQGHVDCTTEVLEREERGDDVLLRLALPAAFARYAASKGSIAVNGVSLTVAEVGTGSFAVWLIPHTRLKTNLGDLRVADSVNLEFDLLAKYVERMLRGVLS